MKWALQYLEKLKSLFERKAIVLMYHRVAEPESDVWELAVSPDRFEQHLKVLKNMGTVVSLQQLANSVHSGHLSKNSIAITFDDGYIDNFKIAKPLLEKYKLPATFFITSGQNEKEFWWDELEHVFLFTAHLPPVFSMVINERLIEFELTNETYLTKEISRKHRLWKACTDEPPTMRAKLFYSVWEQIKPLPFAAQDKYLQLIRKWAGLSLIPRPDYLTIEANQLKQLASNNLFTIGAHTVTHPALAYHNAGFQKKELCENRKFLQEITGQEINLLAYPYGNYNGETFQAASESGFYAAFTTDEKPLKSESKQYSLGRFQVKNLTGAEFKDQLKKWWLKEN
jgi:peptidoglycan/xylan/chitin deacetylase (PgdA/CDA1 family)